MYVCAGRKVRMSVCRQTRFVGWVCGMGSMCVYVYVCVSEMFVGLCVENVVGWFSLSVLFYLFCLRVQCLPNAGDRSLERSGQVTHPIPSHSAYPFPSGRKKHRVRERRKKKKRRGNVFVVEKVCFCAHTKREFTELLAGSLSCKYYYKYFFFSRRYMHPRGSTRSMNQREKSERVCESECVRVQEREREKEGGACGGGGKED